MEPKDTVHKPVWLQLHGGLQPQRKNAVRMGQQAPNHLLSHLELNHKFVNQCENVFNKLPPVLIGTGNWTAKLSYLTMYFALRF